MKLINFKGDLFATVFTFMCQALIKLGSSLILTRLLRPEAYGIITILTSVNFVIGMLGDFGIGFSVVRHEHGDNAAFLNTAWTLRFWRSLLNCAIVFFAAPVIAGLYSVPTLTLPLRVFSLWFVVSALESMSFPIAIRRKNSRITVISELQAMVISTVFTIAYCYISRDFWGMVYGMLVNRLALTALSYRYYPEVRPRLHIDRGAAKELFKFTRFAMPSSLLTLGLSQFDKVVFLRLFDLQLLGVYGLASNIASPIESLVAKISQLVLYPRCAHDYRTNPETYAIRYYTSNTRLFLSILFIPAAVAGAAQLLISTLYDKRYGFAGFVLQAFMVHACVSSLATPAEDMLIASGEFQVLLIANIFCAIWTVSASLLGYYFFGFHGFVYGVALNGLPPLLYYLYLQNKKGYLIKKYELLRFGFVVTVAAAAYVASSTLMTLYPGLRLHR